MQNRKKDKEKKQNKQRRYFFAALIIVLFSLFVIAIADLQEYPQHFWILSFSIPIFVCIMYLVFTRRIVETIAIFVAWFIMLAAGLEDLFVYIIDGFVPSMPHLYDEPIMGGVARLLGLQTVTPFSLVLGVVVCGAVAFFAIFFARKAQNRLA